LRAASLLKGTFMTVRISVSKKESSPVFKSVLIAAIVFAAAVAGVYLGMNLKKGSMAPVEAAQDPNAPSTALAAGTLFPDVPVLDESGAPQSTAQLTGGKGGVYLFMELGCPPCKEMSLKWQAAIESGPAKDIPIFGVTVNLPVNIRPYRLKNKLTFPIFSDTMNVFMDKYDVTNYPCEVVVGKSGKVTYTTFNSAEPIDFDKLKKQLEG
jgi:peroxiredoxin